VIERTSGNRRYFDLTVPPCPLVGEGLSPDRGWLITGTSQLCSPSRESSAGQFVQCSLGCFQFRAELFHAGQVGFAGGVQDRVDG